MALPPTLPTGGVCDQAADDAHTAMERGVSLSRGETAILARSNLTVFSEAVELTFKNPNIRIHFVGVRKRRVFRLVFVLNTE